jgi:thiamine-monophosphate kinase
VGEFELIRKYFARQESFSRVPIGDDCAIFTPQPGVDLCVTTDMLVQDRHFFKDVEPAALGHKALAVNLSDLAAMGARPQSFLLSLGLPSVDETWLAAFAQGMFELAQKHHCVLVGGDTTYAPQIVINIVAHGVVPAGGGVLRSGAVAGQDLWVSGLLGDAAAGLAVLQGKLQLAPSAQRWCLDRLHRPTPRVALGLALAGIATSMLDLSDGLAGDLPHILRASDIAAVLETKDLPLSPALQALPFEQALTFALSGGDDYELLFTADVRHRAEIGWLAKSLELPITRIGQIQPGTARAIWLQDGVPLAHEFTGFDHFRR